MVGGKEKGKKGGACETHAFFWAGRSKEKTREKKGVGD